METGKKKKVPWRKGYIAYCTTLYVQTGFIVTLLIFEIKNN